MESEETGWKEGEKEKQREPEREGQSVNQASHERGGGGRGETGSECARSHFSCVHTCAPCVFGAFGVFAMPWPSPYRRSDERTKERMRKRRKKEGGDGDKGHHASLAEIRFRFIVMRFQTSFPPAFKKSDGVRYGLAHAALVRVVVDGEVQLPHLRLPPSIQYPLQLAAELLRIRPRRRPTYDGPPPPPPPPRRCPCWRRVFPPPAGPDRRFPLFAPAPLHCLSLFMKS